MIACVLKKGYLTNENNQKRIWKVLGSSFKVKLKIFFPIFMNIQVSGYPPARTLFHSKKSIYNVVELFNGGFKIWGKVWECPH